MFFSCRALSYNIFLLSPLLFIKHAYAASNLSAILPLTSTGCGAFLTAEIQIGNQTFDVLPDTGSADLWVLKRDWRCYDGQQNVSGTPVAQEQCDYGNATYTPSETFRYNNDARLGVRYGAGDVYGTLGYDVVTLGDPDTIIMPELQFGLVNATLGGADRYSAGLLGLSLQIISQTHPANVTGLTGFELLSGTLWYETVLLRLQAQGMEPYFAMAINRTPLDQEIGDGGYLTFGTLPPVEHTAFQKVPVEITETIPAALTNGTKKITYWTATVDSVSFDGETYEIPWQAAVDSGNHFFIVPVALARRMNAAFDPPAVFNPDGEEGPVYEVQCNATPPSGVSFEFGARLFHIDPLDLIYRDWDGNCFSTIAPSQPEAGIELLFLGSYFMKNVVIVFDYGNLEMRVADRIPYGISLPGPVATAEVQMQNVAALTSGVNWTTVSLALLCGAAALM